MVGPIDYTMDVLNPIEGMLRGYSLGRQDIEQRQVMQEREQVMGIRGQQEARAQQQFEAQQAAAARQRAQAAAMQEQLMGLREMAVAGTLTPEALNQFALANASTFDEFRSAFQNLSEPRRQETTQFNLQLTSSLFRGNTDVAMSMLDTRIAAAENAGTPETMREAAALKAIRGEIEIDPFDFAVASLANMVSQGAIDSTTAEIFLDSVGQGAEATTAFQTQDQQLRAAGIVPRAEGGDGRYETAMASAGGITGGPTAPAAVSPIGKIAQDVQAGLIPRSVLDAQIRVEERAGEEGLTLQQRIAEEARLRGEYAKRTEDLAAAERNFSVIQTSARDNSGAGDIALVTSFMKMLDPGSVVRETEFATAANSGGLLARLGTIFSKVESGQFLTPAQRADFQRLAGEYLQAAQEQEGRVQDSYRLLVDNYKLDPINVFGARAVTAAPTTPAPTAPAPAPASAPTPSPAPAAGSVPQGFLKSQTVIDAAARAGVTPEEMWAVMSPEQRARYGE